MRNKIIKTIDIKSLIIGMLTTLLLFSLFGNSRAPVSENLIKARTLVITDDDDNEVIKLYASNDGGVIKLFNSSGKVTGILGTNHGGNGQFIALNSNENPMVFVGTSKENAGLVRTFLKNKNIATELGKGFLYTFNSNAKITGYFGTSSEDNGIVKTFNKDGSQDSFIGNSYLRFYNDSSKTSSYLGTADDQGGMIILNDAKGNEIFSK